MAKEQTGPESFPENFRDPNLNGVNAPNISAKANENPERGTSPGLSTADMARAGSAADRPISTGTSGAQAGAAAVRQKEKVAASASGTTPLFDATQSEGLRDQWDKIQLMFVDEPRRSVEEADVLVAGTMKRLAEIFSRERQNLENQWDRGGDVSTEELRIAVQRYRTFFDRLLNV